MGPGMRLLKLLPFCREHYVQLEFPQKKDRLKPFFHNTSEKGERETASVIISVKCHPS